MADAPEAGWYSDPAGKNQLRYWDGKSWTDQTRVTDAGNPGGQRRRIPTIAVVGIVVAALLTIGGFAAIILNASKGSDDPGATASNSPTPTPEATDIEPAERTAPEVVVPEGWELYVSRSGSIEYAVDPSWTSLWSPEYEKAVIGAGGMEGTPTEVAGAWILDGNAFAGGTTLVIIGAAEDAGPPELLELASEEFVRGTAISFGGDSDYEILLSESIEMTQGFEAWHVDYTLTSGGDVMNASVVIFIDDGFTGVVYVMSLDPFEEWLDDFLAVIDSLVLVKLPVSP